MNKHSVIFITNPEDELERFRKDSKKRRSKFLSYMNVSPLEIPWRILNAFTIPYCGGNSRKVYVDFVGPAVAAFLLVLMLEIGQSGKDPAKLCSVPTYVTVLSYLIIAPTICMLFAKLGRSQLSPQKVISLIGYGLYGHLLTISSSILYDFGTSYFAFFLLMSLFGGLTCLRIVVIFIITTPKPIARLIISSLVSIFHLNFLIFINFSYVHRTWQYGQRA